ncbi:MAG: hypothetical protein AAGH15_23160 [Myxococcota bacterium]
MRTEGRDWPAAAEAGRSGEFRRLGGRLAEVEASLEALLGAWTEAFAARAATEPDAALAPSLRDEGRPAACSLHFALSTETALDTLALEHHEALAMLTLLGRRLAILGLSPASAGQGVPALLAACRTQAMSVPEGLADDLSAAFVEGFVRGHGERQRGEWMDALQRAQPFLTPAPGVRLWVAVGGLDAERLGERGQSFARTVHREDAAAALYDLRALPAPGPRRAGALVDALEATRMLGVARAVVADDSWRAVLEEQGELPGGLFVPDLGAALDVGFRAAGLRLRRRRFGR